MSRPNTGVQPCSLQMSLGFSLEFHMIGYRPISAEWP